MMSLIISGSPYYLVGFIVTFFTLMGSRYLLKEEIFPQDKFVRITFISIFWVPCLIAATAVAYVQRGTKLTATEEKLKALQEEVASAREKPADIKQAEDEMNGVTEPEVKEPAPEPKKKSGSWLEW